MHPFATAPAGHGTDWSNLPAWLALLGVLVAGLSYLSGRRDAKRRQASAVFARAHDWKFTDDENARALSIRILNESDLPVFDCGLALYDWGARRRFWRLRDHTRWFKGPRLTARVYPMVLAHSHADADDVRPGLAMPRKDAGHLALHYLTPNIVLVFRDASGRRWVRWPHGKLSRLSPSVSLRPIKAKPWLSERLGDRS